MGVLSEMSMLQQDGVEPFELTPTAQPTPGAFVDEESPVMEADTEATDADEKTEETAAPPAGEKTKAEMDAEEAQKYAEHQAAEAKRKAEWEAKQAAKKAAEQEKLNLVAAMSDSELINASMQRTTAQTERLTRRNMKLCVLEDVQAKCLDDLDFARRVMHPRKSMLNCFHYINRKAKEYLEQEMKDNDIKPQDGIYGGDVPDELCYQWAEEYFRDPDAPEDKQGEEKFIPHPYTGKKPKTAAKPKKAKAEKAKAEKPKEPENTLAQLTFGQLGLEELGGVAV